MNNEEQEKIRYAMHDIIASMCEHPDDVTVNLSPSVRKPIYTLTCHRSDYGVINGKRGAMLDSLKMLLHFMADKGDTVAELILDESGCVGEKSMRGQFAADPEWSENKLDQLLQTTLPLVFGTRVNIGYDKVSSAATKVTIVIPETASSSYALSAETEAAIEMVLRSIGMRQGQVIKTEIVSE